MSIFEVTPVSDLESRAKKHLQNVNSVFEMTKTVTAADYRNFWSPENDPIGILEAMGPNAYKFLAIAYARVQMLVQIATLIGQPELVSEESLLPPYTLVFNEDGSLQSATPK